MRPEADKDECRIGDDKEADNIECHSNKKDRIAFQAHLGHQANQHHRNQRLKVESGKVALQRGKDESKGHKQHRCQSGVIKFY